MEFTKKEKYENPALSFSSTEIILKMEQLKTVTTQYSCDIPEQVSLKHKSKVTSYCSVFLNFSSV